MTETTALATFPKIALPDVTGLTEQMNATFGTMYTRIEEGIANLPTDMSVKANREKVASYAYQISRTKTGLDEAAAGVSSGAKAIVDSVNAERRQLKNTLDILRDKARAALDAWEEAEEVRKANVRDISMRLTNIEIELVGLSSAQLSEKWREIDDIGMTGPEWGEDAPAIHSLKDRALTTINHEIENAKRREAEAAELEQLRREKAEREAAEAARLAEERRKQEEEQERQRQEQERARIAQEEREKAAQEAAEKVRAAEQAAEDAKRQAAEAAEKARRDAAEATERAEREKADAIERDRRERQALIDAKREQDERAAAAKEKADRERAADLAHRRKLNAEAVAALIAKTGISENEAKDVITAIYKGQVPHVTISY